MPDQRTGPGFLRLAPEPTVTPLSIGDAQDSAKAEYTHARAAQRDLVSDLALIKLMYRPGAVSRARLRGELHEARRQAARAQAVVNSLAQALELMETAVTSNDPQPEGSER